MNAIPLRAYNREIEEALEQKLTEEAIAHCRHILKVFPETYQHLSITRKSIPGKPAIWQRGGYLPTGPLIDSLTISYPTLG